MSLPSYTCGPQTKPLLPMTIGAAFDRAVERFSDREAMISLVEEPSIDEIERLAGCAEEASVEVASSYEEIFSSHQTDGLQSESTLNPNR